MATYNVKETDMDTTKIDEFISELEYPYYEVKVLSILRRGDSIHELIKSIISKSKEFEKNIIELCLMYGDNTYKALLIYRNKLTGIRSKCKSRLSNITSHLDNTDDELKSLKIFYQVLYDLAYGALKFVDKVLVTRSVQQLKENCAANIENQNDTSNSKENSKDEPKLPHYNNRYTENQLICILKMLKENAYIDIDTQDADFIYFFSGKGDVPSIGLKWTTIHSTLTIFLKTFFDNDDRIWKKAEVIFNISNLSKTYNRESTKPKGEKCESYFKEFKKKIESI